MRDACIYIYISSTHDKLTNAMKKRRRYNYATLLLLPCRRLSSTILASACIIVFLYSCVAPPPIINRGHVQLYLQALKKTGVEAGRLNLQKHNVFRIPRSGGNLAGLRLSTTNRSRHSYYGCSNPSHNFLSSQLNTEPNKYLLIATSGGLNQQRTGITDAVVAARILNATLVVPTLDHSSYWNDRSNFPDIFDVDRFISYLSKDVKIIKHLPLEGGKVMIPFRAHVPRMCNPSCYQTRISPLLKKKHAVELGKFDFRLSNKLDIDLQKLRCRVNYHALQFTDPILGMGRKLVERMRKRSNHFIALHLRFEADMLAFSGCYYGGGDKERYELGAIRAAWKNLRTKDPETERRNGKCLLTPEEVGLMLRALGFGDDVHIYVASGPVYGGEESLAPLKALFPYLHSKETIASKEELAPFSSFPSRLAALDFIVCDDSDVLVTNNNGNMATMLAGRRRYFGQKATIRPNAKKLDWVFKNRVNNNMTWEEFESQIKTSHQSGFMGDGEGQGQGQSSGGGGRFHENPSSCICQHSEAGPVLV